MINDSMIAERIGRLRKSLWGRQRVRYSHQTSGVPDYKAKTLPKVRGYLLSIYLLRYLAAYLPREVTQVVWQTLCGVAMQVSSAAECSAK